MIELSAAEILVLFLLTGVSLAGFLHCRTVAKKHYNYQDDIADRIWYLSRNSRGNP